MQQIVRYFQICTVIFQVICVEERIIVLSFQLKQTLHEILPYIFESTRLYVACISFLLFNKNIDTPRTKLSAHLNCNASIVRGAGHVTLIFFPEIANFPPPYLQV